MRGPKVKSRIDILPIMNRLLFIIVTIILTINGCESKHNAPDKIPDGIYTGTFQRQQAFGGGEIVQVTITFTSNTWTGQSSFQKYPALCHGTYKLDNQKITFTNDCIWTAEFDHSLILSGEFEFELINNQLTIIRSYLGPSTDTWSDNYSLTKVD
jgi:hypothetical protein